MEGQEDVSQAVMGISSESNMKRILWLHSTDRWYFGDFLRHAAWLAWLRTAFPAATIDLASHPAYLPLYRTIASPSTWIRGPSGTSDPTWTLTTTWLLCRARSSRRILVA